MGKKGKGGVAAAAAATEPEPVVDPNAPPPPEPVPPVSMLYCGVCTYPPEYCEFGSSLTRCKDWLKDHHPNLFDKYYSEEALQTKVGTLSLEAQSKLEKDVAKKEVKAEAKAEAALKKKMASQVIIKRSERNKRKCITTVFGLEAFDIDLKKAAKQFASKFATGASVTKNPQGLEEIVISGDVSDEVLEMIENQVGVLKGIPADNVELVEEKKKKAAE
ncbi:Translation machinery-associated protein 22 [Mycena indigotica]|uniref:Translation machinery-associated protein 22 n=1 Tax=Mycena indigotica TaxID=2126181 RepID=A0A8H6W5T7_9AGAR|nr:Translation machinery-associated protein 22 [Mycena indigotica]KAF7303871.1 Translation machinery-associated protein 22 [Mycena indigotica]